jgi:hypothetical protein
MKVRSEAEENAFLDTCSQGFAREVYPVRYVDRTDPRMRAQTSI